MGQPGHTAVPTLYPLLSPWPHWHLPLGSFSSHTPGLCLLWQLFCLLPELLDSLLAKHNEAKPVRTQFQTQSGPSGTGNGLQTKEVTQTKAAPCTGFLLQVLITQRERTQDLPIVGQGFLLLRQLWLASLGIKDPAGDRWGNF